MTSRATQDPFGYACSSTRHNMSALASCCHVCPGLFVFTEKKGQMQLQGPKLTLLGSKKIYIYLDTGRHIEPFTGILENPTTLLLFGIL